jgi:hypothetical protein
VKICLDGTRLLMKELEDMKFDYDKCVFQQVKIIEMLIREAGNSGFSAACVRKMVKG